MADEQIIARGKVTTKTKIAKAGVKTLSSPRTRAATAAEHVFDMTYREKSLLGVSTERALPKMLPNRAAERGNL